MRVLHVFKTYIPDSFAGIERVIWHLAEGCSDLGIESEVLSLSVHPQANSMQVGRHFAAKSSLLAQMASTGISLDFIAAFRERAEAADVVHYHFPWPMMDVAHLITRPGKPSVLTYHSDIVRQKWLSRIYAPLQHAFLRRVDAIVATSPQYTQTSPILAQYKNKLDVIPIGIDPMRQSQPSAERLEYWRQRFGDRFFLFVGSLRYYKGMRYLIEAARLSGLPLVIVGQGEMQRDVVEANLPNITMVGAVPDEDKAALLKLCTAFVFSSHLRSEAFGVALLEAAFAGKPMISCELGTGTSYVNRDGETGLIVKPADARGLSEAMRILWSDEALCRRFGDAALRRANALFNAEKMSKGYSNLYRRLLEKANG